MQRYSGKTMWFRKLIWEADRGELQRRTDAKEGRKNQQKKKTAGKYNRRNDRHERKVIADAKEQG